MPDVSKNKNSRAYVSSKGLSITVTGCELWSNLLNNTQLLQLYDVGGAHLEKGALAVKTWSNNVAQYLNSIKESEMFLGGSDKAFNFLVTACSISLTYLFVRKLHQAYQNSKAKSKEDLETQQIEEDIKEQQRVATLYRSENECCLEDKRDKCILCIENKRECVFLDCGHICVCVDCLKSLPFPKTCPICRCKIVQTVLLFSA